MTPTPDSLVAEVIGILRQLKPEAGAVTPRTLILTELGVDSLKMIELIDILKARYGVDFFAPPLSLDDLSSPETIAAALARSKK